MTDNGKANDSQLPGQGDAGRDLPKRFYTDVSVELRDEGHTIHLDGRPVRSPAKNSLALPTQVLAQAIAAEWEAQVDVIDPETMHLTRIANSAIDGVKGREAELIDEIVNYAASDLLCYRAEHPEQLVQNQAHAWDPLLSWAATDCGISLQPGGGIMPIAQSKEALAAVRAALEGAEALELAPMHVLVTLSGSAVLGLAVRRGHIEPAAAWTVAHVDEDWQIEQWGEDAEASARRAYRWQEFAAAARFLMLLQQTD